MNDKDIYVAMLNDDNLENIVMIDDDGNKFEMTQIGTMPMHGVVYGILDLIKINDIDVTEEESGLVMLELDSDEESGECFVSTVEDDELFNEVLDAFNNAPEE